MQTERSQHANKRLATLMIAHRLATIEVQNQEAARATRRLLHHQIERGNPKRVFRGAKFELSSTK